MTVNKTTTSTDLNKLDAHEIQPEEYEDIPELTDDFFDRAEVRVGDRIVHQPDWAALDALTDDEIAAQIAADPDAAPDVSDWPLDKATIRKPTDVKAIRRD